MPVASSARRGALSTPDPAATRAGQAVLDAGGTAIEAAVAASALLCVSRPDLCGLGGDAVWLIAEPGRPALSIDGTGAVAAGLDPAAPRPARGPGAAVSVAGLVSGWQRALDLSLRGGRRPDLAALLAPAITAAREGIAAAPALTRRLADPATPDPVRAWFPDPARLTQPALAGVLEQLAVAGPDDFYRGAVGAAAATDLAALGSPLVGEDLARHRGQRRRPLTLTARGATLAGAAPPSQGLAGLVLFGLLHRLGADGPPADGVVHAAQACAIAVRDTHLGDPTRMRVHAGTYLSDGMLDRLAERLDPAAAAPPPAGEEEAAAWVLAVDSDGRGVSLALGLGPSPFGAGVVLPGLGILWQARGGGFGPEGGPLATPEPRRRPGQSLAPALARGADGTLFAFGCTGGLAQPARFGRLAASVLLWGEDPAAALARLATAEGLGSAGVLAAAPDGTITAA